MNHQFYVDLLFDDAEDLTSDQSLVLHEHLETCEDCRSLIGAFSNLEKVLGESGLQAPNPGFTTRWQTRLEASRQGAHRRQTLAILGFVGVGSLALLVLMIVLLWPWLRSPDLLFWTWVYQLFSLYTYLRAMREIISPLAEVSPFILGLIAWFFGLGLISELAVLWVVSLRLITNPRRVTK